MTRWDLHEQSVGFVSRSVNHNFYTLSYCCWLVFACDRHPTLEAQWLSIFSRKCWVWPLLFISTFVFFFCRFIPFRRCTRMVADSIVRLQPIKMVAYSLFIWCERPKVMQFSNLTYMMNRKLMGESTGSQGRYHILTSIKKRKADRCKLDVNGTFWIYIQIK